MRVALLLVSFTGLLLLGCVTPEDGPRKTEPSARLPEEAPVKQKAGRKTDPNALRQAAMNDGGDPKRGQAIYRSAAIRCSTCHKVHGQGGDGGPDLSQVGGKLDRTHLIESILDPSAEIPAGYHVTVIETR